MLIIIPFLMGLIIMLVLMIKTRIGPFMSMLIGAMIIGIGCGVSAKETISAISSGFGGIAKSIGIVIIFGAILGEYLEKSYATERIAKTLLKATGKQQFVQHPKEKIFRVLFHCNRSAGVIIP